MDRWIRATSKVVDGLADGMVYVVIYDGGKTGKFSGAFLKAAHNTESVILDWIIEMPI